MGQNSFQFASREIWFAYANFSDSTVRLREIWFACTGPGSLARDPTRTFQTVQLVARDLVRLHEILRELSRQPLKDEKTAFSAFLLFQATFHSKSFAPQI
ncbi:hypothetical protein QL285_063120 [Trifolium repens]|nr:hypothetical protein QL285_063120 [Trifolium repens]